MTQLPAGRLLRAATALAVGATIGLLLHRGSPMRADWWLGALPFFGWTIAPLLAPWLYARRRAARAGPALVALAAGVALGGWLYGRAFYDNPSSTAALALIAVPLWQWAAVLIAGGVALLVQALRHRE